MHFLPNKMEGIHENSMWKSAKRQSDFDKLSLIGFESKKRDVQIRAKW